MKMTLLILSAVIFHLPHSFFEDTIRRYKRMQLYNPEKAYLYEQNNGGMDSFLSINVFGYVLSLVVALIPLFKAFPLRWYAVILIIMANILYMVFVSSFLAYFMYPTMAIFWKSKLKEITIVCTIIATVLLVIGWFL